MFSATVSASVFAAIVFCGSALGFFRPAGENAIGKKAQSVKELTYVQGEPVDVECGESVKVVEYWATWCPPCKTAIPELNELWKKLQSEYGEKKVQLVGITNEKSDKVVPFIEKEMEGKMQYPVALDENNSLASSYPVSTIPAAFVVGKCGTVLWSGHPSGLEPAVRRALDAKAAAGAPQANPAPANPAPAKPTKAAKPAIDVD